MRGDPLGMAVHRVQPPQPIDDPRVAIHGENRIAVGVGKEHAAGEPRGAAIVVHSQRIVLYMNMQSQWPLMIRLPT